MKKLIILICCLSLSVTFYGQEIEEVISTSKSQYEGKSYEVWEDLKLTTGFQARAGVEGQFFGRIKEFDLIYEPAAESIAPLNSNITITFNDVMDLADIQSEISVTGTQVGVINGVWTQTGREYTFNPTNDFLSGEIITVNITDQLTGIYGRWVPKAYRWHFNNLEPVTYIPDANFELFLYYKNIDDALDKYVATSSIQNIQWLTIEHSVISDLRGIEDFSALKYLNLYNVPLTSLDISNNLALTRVALRDVPLTNLDVSNNTALTYLNLIHPVPLTSLDVSNNTALTYLSFSSNAIASLDVSNNTALTYLNCGSNAIASLDVSNNTALTYLNCRFSALTSLDISNNTALTYLNCGFSALTSLDISNNSELTYLNCQKTQINDLIVENKPNLIELDFRDNNNLLNLVISGTKLERIEVNNTSLTTLEVSNNIALKALLANSVQLTTLDVYNNLSMWYLSCPYNQLTSLDVSNNAALKQLICNNNNLTSLDVSSNTALKQLICNNNQLTSLDVTNNTALISLYCQNNQLTSLDVSNSPLKYLDLSNNLSLTSLDVTNNTALTHLYCHNNQLTNLDVSTNTALDHFSSQNNPNLNCIKVNSTQRDDIPEYWSKDASTTYSLNCSFPGGPSPGMMRMADEPEIDEVFGDLKQMVIYPNPTKDVFIIDFEEFEGAVVEIYDLTGSILFRSSPLTDSKTQIPIKGYKPGIVIVNVTKAQSVKSFRLTIE